MRFTVESGGVRARAVAFGMPRLPDGCEDGLDATFGLELNEWNGAVEPRLVLRDAVAPQPRARRAARRPRRCRTRAARPTSATSTAAASASRARWACSPRRASACSRCAPTRRAGQAALEPRLGGFTVAGWEAVGEATRLRPRHRARAAAVRAAGRARRPRVGRGRGGRCALAAHRYRWDAAPARRRAVSRAARRHRASSLPRAGVAILVLEELGSSRTALLVDRRHAHAARALGDVRRGRAPAREPA